ncbi:hypothetical protein Cgig2_028053 [Carnegiea gigantea]|uniref:Uncharacterized protein n=1 Tax=Carnegiea gigantea TaxID=171969 RepID=A0A9Q1Q5L4_9CARY|nr:hypothetical protein Cgig2_028053 [Carnegiea gigantea]
MSSTGNEDSKRGLRAKGKGGLPRYKDSKIPSRTFSLIVHRAALFSLLLGTLYVLKHSGAFMSLVNYYSLENGLLIKAMQTPFRSYLQDMLALVKREREEREALECPSPTIDPIGVAENVELLHTESISTRKNKELNSTPETTSFRRKNDKKGGGVPRNPQRLREP